MRAVHPDLAALMILAAGTPALGTLPPAEARRSYSASRRALHPVLDPVASIEDITMPGPGGPLALRVYRGAPGGGSLPCLLFLHGGGWVLGDLESHEGICRRIAAAAGCCVVAVDYRLAPEHPVPGGGGGRCGGFVLGGGAGRDPWASMPPGIAVGGDSAGGNLAAVIALMGRDGTVPRCMYQILFYPVTDLGMTGESYERVITGMPLTAARCDISPITMCRCMRTGAIGVPPRYGPPAWRARPPALVLTCGHDPLCTEGATLRRAAGARGRSGDGLAPQ